MSAIRGWMMAGLLAVVTSSVALGQYPYGASDTTYGLRSRVAENPAFTYTASPSDWRDINIYQLFTDRFADGNTGNNPVSKGWYCDGKNFPYNRNFHHGGDWKGLKDNLDYLAGMGVKAIWMSGVQMNDQGKDLRYTPYHMYHPTDFFRVDPVLGTFQELKDLIDACHARGIYVILDVVINHTADKNGIDGDTGYYANGGGNHRWWNDSNKHAAPFNDLQYFHNNGTINNWDSYPEYIYGQFKGTDDLKTDNSQVQTWMDEAFKNLIDATDCDGFRVDAIKHVEYNWCKAWADNMRKHAAFRGKNDFILFGEYFSYDNNTLASYCKDAGYSYNSALFFPLSQNIKSVFVDGSGPSQLTQQLNNKGMYGEGGDRLVAFIDNHDVNRISLMNGGDSGNDVWKLRPALSFLYLGTPVPCLFYGTEHVFDQGGHYNGSNKTEDNPDDGDWQRECMFDKGFQPGPAQGNKLAATTAPLYQHIKALNQARADYKSLTRGSFTEKWADGAYAFSRIYDNEEALVAINLGDGSKSINPTVSKPDGTEFVNALNPSEKVTVSGGKLAFTMSGRETKAYVAGIPAPQMWVKGTHNYPADGVASSSDDVFVNTEAGPTGLVTSVKVGYSADGGTTWNSMTMTPTNWTSSSTGTWYFAGLGKFPANSVIKYYIEIADAQGNKKWDNNNGLNYTLTIKAAAGVWARSSRNYPVDGDATDATDLYVNSEAGPSGQVTQVTAVFSTNGTSWTRTAMAVKSDWESVGGRWYELNLGQFSSNTVVRYYVEATDGVTTNKDDNNGANFSVTIRGSGVSSFWVGGSRHTPTNGAITAASTIAITSESWPIGAATNVGLVYSVDGGANWQATNLTFVGTNSANDLWSVNVGPYANGTIVRYAVVGQSVATELWDNNGGQNFQAIVGEVGALLMVEHSPVISAGGSPDNVGDQFDFAVSGGAATTAGTNGFGSFGSIYVNYDATNLYVGGTGVALPTDSTNNAYMIFLGGGTNAGSGNFWNFNGLPNGIDQLHNAAFQPNVNVAILLGDVYGDGTFTNFDMYGNTLFNYGQGVFATPGSGTAFLPVGGAKLSQFGGYGVGNRLAANWECAIPLATFGVTNASALTNLYMSGLMVTYFTSNNNRFISGRYLGASATLGNGEQADEWGNFATSFVNLAGLKVLPPQSANQDMGVPDSWVTNHFGPGYHVTTNSNHDGDDHSDRNEYFAGLDPTVSDDLDIMGMQNGRMSVRKVGGQACTYVIDTADRVENGSWNWAAHATVTSLDGYMDLPSLGLTSAVMRVRVNVPAVDQPGDSVRVGASPAGGTFTTTNISVTLSVSGVNVTSATYTVQGASAMTYANGQIITFGTGMTNGESRTLTLNGSTVSGVTAQNIYTFTRSAPNQQISWTGNVATDPASGSWDTNETLTISFQTAPLGAAASVGAVYSANGGLTWVYTNLAKTGSSASNDLWAVTLAAKAAGTLVQYALEAKDAQGNSTWNNNNSANYSIAVNGGGSSGGNGKFTPYSTNPTKGAYRPAGITVDGANGGGEWTTNMLVALDMANDDPRSLGSNWTMHEAPADLTHLWACWDDTKLYLAWQFADVTDKLDPSNAGSALGGRISNSQGILQFISFDTIAAQGAASNMWGKLDRMTGSNLPDYQIGLRSDLYSAYISRSVDGIFAGDAGLGVDYFTAAAKSITIARAPGLASPTLYGAWDLDTYLANTNSALTEFVGTGHDTSRDSFYEIAIPFTALGITKAQIESSGIGVFINVGSASSIDCIPNDPATLNTPGVTGSNSTWEWEDGDQFNVPYVRIGN